MVFKNYISLTDAVRAGARVAVVSRPASDPTGTAKAAVVNAGQDIGLTTSRVTVTSTWQAGADVTVTATYPYTFSFLGLNVVSGNLSSSTTMRVE